MTYREVLYKLCYHDSRNPYYDPEYDRKPRINCYCDNCFYGRDELALELLKYIKPEKQS